MKKSDSFIETNNIKHILLTTESENYLESDEIYKLIKNDYHHKLKTSALNFLRKDNKYNKKILLNLPPKIPSLLNTINNMNNNNNNNSLLKTPINHNKKSSSFNKILLKQRNDIDQRSSSLSLPNANMILMDKDYHNTKSVYSLLDKKITEKSLLSLRVKFFSNQKLTRGEITEMTYGKKIPMILVKTFTEDYQKKIKEVLSNAPQIVINLIQYGTVTQKEVIDYFNLDALSVDWNENLESEYRQLVYSKHKTNSNMLKTTFFLVNIGFHKILRKKFEEKHYISAYNPKEIDEFAMIYEKLKKFSLQSILSGYSKIAMLFQIRNDILNNIVTCLRNKFFNDKVQNFRKIRNKSEKCLTDAHEEIQRDFQEQKVLLNNLRGNLFKNVSKLKINTPGFRHPIEKINRILQNKKDIKNIMNIIKIKQSKKYCQTLIASYIKDGILPGKKNKKFNFDIFMKTGDDNKKIIHYFAALIQSNVKGYMIRKCLKKMQICASLIQKKLSRYITFKTYILNLFKVSIEEFKYIDKRNYELFREPALKIRILIRSLLRNYNHCSFYLFDEDVEELNQLYDKGYFKIPYKAGPIEKSWKMLTYLETNLYKLYRP